MPNKDSNEIPAIWQEFDNWYGNLSYQEIQRGLKEGVWPEGSPDLFITLAAKVTTEEKLLWGIFGNYPSTAEIQARPDNYVTKKEAEARKRRGKELAVHLGQPDSRKSLKTLQAEYDKIFGILEEQVYEVLNSLNTLERQVLQARFGLRDGRSVPQEELAVQLGITPEEVDKIEAAALNKLRGKKVNV